MTASITGLGAGEKRPTVAQRPQSPPHPGTHDWQSVYQRQLLRKRDATSPRRVVEAKGPPAPPPPRRQPDSDRAPLGLRAVVIPVGNHLELRFVPHLATPLLESSATGSAAIGDPRGISSGAREALIASRAEPGALAPAPELPLVAVAPPWQQTRSADSVSGHRGLEPPLGSVATEASALTVQALASAAVRPATRIDEVPERSGTETSVPPAVALALVASQGSIGPPLPPTGSSRERQQGTLARQSGSAEIAAGASAPPGRSHGTFPLIVSGQLLELEFLSLQRRGRSGPDAAQQIVMSLQPPGMPRVELTARKLEGKVAVTLGGAGDADWSGPGDPGRATLDLPALLRRLGWGSLPVEFTSAPIAASGVGVQR